MQFLCTFARTAATKIRIFTLYNFIYLLNAVLPVMVELGKVDLVPEI